MDNFHFDITSEGDTQLALAMKIAFKSYNQKAIGYRISKEKGLIFYWTPAPFRDGYIDLPFKLDDKGAADFVSRWLAEQDYGSEPDHDGDNGKGWRVYNEDWGHIDGEWQAFVAIRPVWAWYGK